VTDRDALLRTIADSPGDDAPRLIYADWCTEHGEPESGEFIRRLLQTPRGAGDVAELVKHPAPNGVAYFVRADGADQAAADVLRAIPFEFLPGRPLENLTCQRLADDRWQVVAQYKERS
jgi:uncharacterized protein (TIGR02996 family)